MQAHTRSEVLRRSSRVPIAVPLLVTSLDPSNDFSEVCETLVVSAHGCAIRSPMQVKAGIPVHFHTKQGRQMMARIVDCQPVGTSPQAWTMGAQLDEPDNVWGLNPCPEDWLRACERKPAPNGQQLTGGQHHKDRSNGQSAGLFTAPQNLPQQLPSDHLQAMIGPLLQPLQAEIAVLREKLAQREAHRSRFEVSLSQIPAELEQQLWARLRQELEPRALQLTREESERLLGTAYSAIEQRISLTQGELRQHASEELKRVAQRAQAFSEEAAQAAQQQFRAHMEQLQQHILAEQTRLKGQSEELAGALCRQLEEEHRAQRQDMQRAQDAFAAVCTSVKAQLAEIDGRLAKLDDSAHRLEADLDTHVAGVASELVSGATAQLESTAELLLNQLRTRNTQGLEVQLHDACERLRDLQKEIKTSISESLQTQIAHTLQGFEGTVHELAERCIGHWRSALASQLNSFANTLAEQLQTEVPPDRSRAGE
jgi:hypothetical protein